MLNRNGLDVLVHPLTEDAVEDHSSYAIWLGSPVELKLHAAPRTRRPAAERSKRIGTVLSSSRKRGGAARRVIAQPLNPELWRDNK